MPSQEPAAPAPCYMFVFRGIDDAKESASAAELDAMLDRWAAWARDLRRRGVLNEGAPLVPEGAVVTRSEVIDGPFAESKELVGGYFIVRAASLDEAIAHASDCPGLEVPGMSVEVRRVSGT